MKAVLRTERVAVRRELPVFTWVNTVPSSVRIECRDARDHRPGEHADLAVGNPGFQAAEDHAADSTNVEIPLPANRWQARVTRA